MDDVSLLPGQGLVYWLGFDQATTFEAAAARFREKFGQEPERVFLSHRVVLAGPVPMVRLGGGAAK